MVSHALKELGRFPGHAPHDSLELGRQGVTIFFTLSGFLITYLLLEETQRFGRIDLRAFYLRRALRIWPLYFCYLAIAMAYHGQCTGAALMVLFLSNVAFVTNRLPADTAPLWSIGVEEQFYLVWPLVVRHVRRLAPVLLGVIVALPVARGVVHRELGPGRHVANDLLGTLGYDAMAMGALFAIAYHRRSARLLRWARSPLPHLLFAALVILLAANQLGFLHIALPPATAAISGLFIVAQVASTRPLLDLERPVLRFVGRVSFGVYVYHMLVITLLVRVLGDRVVPAPLIVLAVCVVTIAVANVSYRLLEAPFLRKKRALARIQP
jgi:peptidoglycan/LPS O-acetylase OafA/YrhL